MGTQESPNQPAIGAKSLWEQACLGFGVPRSPVFSMRLSTNFNRRLFPDQLVSIGSSVSRRLEVVGKVEWEVEPFVSQCVCSNPPHTSLFTPLEPCPILCSAPSRRVALDRLTPMSRLRVIEKVQQVHFKQVHLSSSNPFMRVISPSRSVPMPGQSIVPCA